MSETRIEGAWVVDVLRGLVERSDWVVPAGGRLAKAETLAETIDCQRIEASGRYIAPGLIDAHVHLGRPSRFNRTANPQAPGAQGVRESVGGREPEVEQPAREGKEYVSDSIDEHVARAMTETLAAGITTVRDLGDRWPRGRQVAESAQGRGVPEVVSALSGLTAQGCYGEFLGEAVRDRYELVAAIRSRYEAGAKVIKLFLTGGVDFASGQVGGLHFEPDAVRAAASMAHDFGLRLAVHANGPAAVTVAALSGADTIEHGILISEDGLRAMLDKGLYWVPTLTPLWRALSDRRKQTDGAQEQGLRVVFERHRESVAKAFGMGIKVVAGTDSGSPGVPHGCLVEELERFVETGIAPAEVLKSATVWAAEALGIGTETGLVTEGRRGDLLILTRSPLEDIRALGTIEHVVAQGTIVHQGR